MLAIVRPGAPADGAACRRSTIRSSISIFFWVSLSTSWALLSGFAGYFSLGHAAFFGVGMYTTATSPPSSACRSWPPCRSRPRCRPCWRVGIGAVVFRLRRLRGELFALLTLAVTFVIATIILNTPIDGGGGVFMSAVPLPRPHADADRHDLHPGLRACAC